MSRKKTATLPEVNFSEDGDIRYLHLASPTDGHPTRFKEAFLDRLLECQGQALPSRFDEMDTAFSREMAPVWVGQRTGSARG